MLISTDSLNGLFEGFKTSFNKGLESAPSHYKSIAMLVNSSAAEETYAWLGQFPRLREWVGDRVIKNLAAHSYAVRNKVFETTIAVKRTSIEDDQYGIYGPLMMELGRTASEHPDELVFALLASGLTTTCYDGQYFFDTDHPVQNADGTTASVSNYDFGGGSSDYPWFLLDTSRAIKPMLFQERMPYDFQQLTQDGTDNVFLRDEYLYGVRGRANAGFGLWQLAYASQATLDGSSYAAARTAMMSFKGDEGRPLGIRPDTMVVPPALEQKALQLLQNQLVIQELGGTAISNEWMGTAKLIVTPWLT